VSDEMEDVLELTQNAERGKKGKIKEVLRYLEGRMNERLE
jgi:hypothetical protein